MDSRNARVCSREDLERIRLFLLEAGLNTDGIGKMIEQFFVLEDKGGNIHGALGIETAGNAGLLRSFAVTKNVDYVDILFFFTFIFSWAKERGLEQLFLATNKGTSADLFSILGFERETGDDVWSHLSSFDHIKFIETVDNVDIYKKTMG